MRAKSSFMAAACLLGLFGCSPSRHDLASDACRAAVAGKVGGKNFSLDQRDKTTTTKNKTADVIAIASTIVFDKGLSTESRQSFDCRVRLADGKPADVIGLQFNWSKDDLKKVKTDIGG